MDYQALRTHILGNHECTAFVITAQMPYDAEYYIKDQIIADILNRPAGTRLVERYENAIGLMSAIGTGTAAAILEKLDTAKATIPALKWAMYAIESSEGINIGDSETQALLDTLATNNILTELERDLIKNLAIKPSSIAIDIFGREISAADVSIALRNY